MSEAVCIPCEILVKKRESQRLFADAFKAIKPIAEEYARKEKLSTITVAQMAESGELIYCESNDSRLGNELKEITILFI